MLNAFISYDLQSVHRSSFICLSWLIEEESLHPFTMVANRENLVARTVLRTNETPRSPQTT